MAGPAPLWPPPQRVSLDATARAPSTPPVIVVGPCGLPDQGYRIRIDATGGVRVDATDGAGAAYARTTLRQLTELHDGQLPVGTVEDWPDIAVRGIMLDVSRGRVPTVATLSALIDRLAALKINHVELYLEHTFAYRGHEEVWADASPYTAEDLRTVDAYAAARGVEVTAQQNCLGHMERWLRHAQYQPLAIAPDGFDAPWGARMPPMTMDPSAPGALALARDLLGQVLPTLTSGRAHVGLDEPWELPAERSPEWAVYLRGLRDAPETASHDLLVWGDLLTHHPDLLGAVPGGVTVCEWGYEADHPFAARAAVLAERGLPFWLSPGTSSWNSIAGRWSNSIANISAAAEAATTYEAGGLMVTDWGDNGHVQHLSVAEPLMAWSAGCGWNSAGCDPGDLAAVVDWWVAEDPGGGLGAAQHALGDAHTGVTPQLVNQSILTAHLYRPEVRFGHSKRTSGVIDAELSAVSDVIAHARRAASTHDETVAAADLLALLVDDARARLAGDGSLASVSTATRHALAERLDAVTDEHRRLWLARDRPGGLDESVAVLSRLRAAYLADD